MMRFEVWALGRPVGQRLVSVHNEFDEACVAAADAGGVVFDCWADVWVDRGLVRCIEGIRALPEVAR